MKAETIGMIAVIAAAAVFLTKNPALSGDTLLLVIVVWAMAGFLESRLKAMQLRLAWMHDQLEKLTRGTVEHLENERMERKDERSAIRVQLIVLGAVGAFWLGKSFVWN